MKGESEELDEDEAIDELATIIETAEYDIISGIYFPFKENYGE